MSEEKTTRQEAQQETDQQETDQQEAERREMDQQEAQGPLSQSSREPRQQGESPLVTDRGSTSVSKSAVSQVVNTVAGKAEGVRLGSSGLGRSGVSIDVGQEEVAMDLKVSADYNRSVLQVTESLRHDITDRIETMLGLRVKECNITVDDFYFPGEESQEDQGRQEEEEEPRVR